MIELQNVEKYYGKLHAVKPTTITVKRGEVFALLGPNGSGKSTILRTAVGLIKPDGGRILVDGLDAWKQPLPVKRLVSYIPQRVTMPENLTGRELVRFHARLRGLPRSRINEVLAAAGLNGHSKKYVREFSGGLLQRLGLAVAMLEDAPVLIMDEPTLNLDPGGMQQFRRYIRRRKEEGATILFASHVLADAESIADRVGIMVEGRLVRTEAVAALREEIRARTTVLLRVEQQDENLLVTAREAGAAKVWFDNENLCFQAPAVKRLVVLEALKASGLNAEGFSTREPALDRLIMEHFDES